MAVCFVLPALVEELFFRGFLFSALRARCSASATVVITGLLFGFFHVIVTGAFAFERLLPSTLLGLLLGWVCLRTGSVIPGMIMHALHNGMLVIVGQGELAASEQIPAFWLAAGAFGTLAGGLLLQFSMPRNSPP
jgi:ABC-2 type transport system permease protein/sodium transport system permease protein